MVVPTLGWAQAVIRPVDAETNFKINTFSCQYVDPMADTTIIESKNGEAILPIKNSSKIVIYAEGYLPKTELVFPNTISTHSHQTHTSGSNCIIST